MFFYRIFDLERHTKHKDFCKVILERKLWMKTIPEIQVYVRYCETDASGHVNNTSYFLYMEEARTRFLDFLRKEIGSQDWNFILASTKCDYLAQAYAHQTLTVASKLIRIGTKSFTIEHEMRNSETGVIVARGNAVVVCFDFHKQQSQPISPKLRSILEEFLA